MIEQTTLHLDGKTVEIRKTGSGPPLLYLHSAIGEFWVPEFVELLSSEFQIICPAHPGFGESNGLESIQDIEDMAFHYADVISALDLEFPHLVGLSLGGWIAAEIAVRWPDLPASLTLIDSVGIWLDEAPIVQMWGIKTEELAPLLFKDLNAPLAQMIASLDLDELPPEDILLQFIGNQTATAKIGWDPYLHNPKLESRLARITCPTLIMWGEDDRLVPKAHAERYGSLISTSKTELIPGGHLAVLESPKEASTALAKFLATLPARQS